jgi:hypothetical protein
MIWAALELVPIKVWASLAVFLAVLGLVWYVHHDGYSEGVAKGDAKVKKLQAAWDAERAQLYAAVEAEKAREAEVVTKVEVRYVDRVKVVKEKGEEVIREVEKLIPATCVLPGAFRVLHDAAAGAQPLPADPGRASATADAVDCATALETVATNYQAALQSAERLRALQELVTSLERKP